MLSKAKQKEVADSILHGTFLIDAAHPKVGQVYQTMVRRRGPEFVGKRSSQNRKKKEKVNA